MAGAQSISANGKYREYKANWAQELNNSILKAFIILLLIRIEWHLADEMFPNWNIRQQTAFKLASILRSGTWREANSGWHKNCPVVTLVSKSLGAFYMTLKKTKLLGYSDYDCFFKRHEYTLVWLKSDHQWWWLSSEITKSERSQQKQVVCNIQLYFQTKTLSLGAWTCPSKALQRLWSNSNNTVVMKCLRISVLVLCWI